MTIPVKTNERMSTYLAAFMTLKRMRDKTVNSAQLEEKLGILATTIRRDMMELGNFGKQRVGYDVDTMITVIGRYLERDEIAIGTVHIVYRRDICTGEETVFGVFNNSFAASLTVENMNDFDLVHYEYKYQPHDLNKIAIKGEKENAGND